MNYVVISGVVCGDVMVYGKTETNVTKFRMSTSKRITNKDGEIVHSKDYFNVVAFRSLGKLAAQLENGSIISVVGELKNNNWTDKEGKKHYDIQIVAREISIIPEIVETSDDGKAGGNDCGNVTQFAEINDDDLPF